MRRINLLKLLTLVLLGSTFAYSQASRTWVSGVGDDANPCSRTAPCKTFAGAISKTAPGGEIDALDPGGFGALTITKSITLDGGGGQVASVLVAGTNGIVVAAGAGDVVIIRNLRLDGLRGGGNANAGINGIRWLSGAELHIEHVTIFGFNNNGIDIAKSDGGHAFVSDTTTANNANCGLQSLNTTTNVNTTIFRSEFKDIVCGVKSSDFSVTNIQASQASGAQYGIIAQSNNGTSEVNISNSLVADNSVAGLYSGGGATPTSALIRITGVSLFHNGAGMITAASGSIGSWGNNYNTGGGAPSGTAMPQ